MSESEFCFNCGESSGTGCVMSACNDVVDDEGLRSCGYSIALGKCVPCVDAFEKENAGETDTGDSSNVNIPKSVP